MGKKFKELTPEEQISRLQNQLKDIRVKSGIKTRKIKYLVSEIKESELPAIQKDRIFYHLKNENWNER